MQQIRQHRRVSNIGSRGHRRVDDLDLAVHSHVGFHPEVLLIALLGLVHLRIAPHTIGYVELDIADILFLLYNSAPFR